MCIQWMFCKNIQFCAQCVHGWMDGWMVGADGEVRWREEEGEEGTNSCRCARIPPPPPPPPSATPMPSEPTVCINVYVCMYVCMNVSPPRAAPPPSLQPLANNMVVVGRLLEGRAATCELRTACEAAAAAAAAAAVDLPTFACGEGKEGREGEVHGTARPGPARRASTPIPSPNGFTEAFFFHGGRAPAGKWEGRGARDIHAEARASYYSILSTDTEAPSRGPAGAPPPMEQQRTC